MTQRFNSRRDKGVIAAGTHFWCQGHLTARSVTDRSPDPRYCQSCYDFLLNEYQIMKMFGHVKTFSWLPKAEQSPTATDSEALPNIEAVTTVADKELPIGDSVTANFGHCLVCGTALVGFKRSDVKFCSPACKQKYHRKRKGIQQDGHI